jgi:mRNA-degrading endonuclease RelE of RelBE toxin-antitoxin system
MSFRIEFSPAAHQHLHRLSKRDQKILVEAISRQLRNQPDQPTRNRKRLEANVLAPWELRVGAFRVFYDVDRESESVVILAIGQKKHNILYIGGEEFRL